MTPDEFERCAHTIENLLRELVDVESGHTVAVPHTYQLSAADPFKTFKVRDERDFHSVRIDNFSAYEVDVRYDGVQPTAANADERIPPYTGRIITRPYTLAAVGFDPAGAPVIATPVRVTYYARALAPSTYSLDSGERAVMPTAPTPFPSWAVRKVGQPLLTEADWNYAGLPNAKFGMFATSTGTLARDQANLFYGGAGSCKMLTAAANQDSTEVKNSHDWIVPKGWLIAFEQKWAQAFGFGSTAFDMGIENRTNPDIRHVRFRYTITSGKWQYQQPDQTYADFPAAIGGALPVEKPTISAASGTKFGWARAVIDPFNNRYVGFEASGQAGGIETRDMRSLNVPCCTQGASTAWELLFFTLLIAGGAGAEAGYTTDWCVSLIPPGVDPFNG